MIWKNFFTQGWRRLPDDGRMSFCAAGGCLALEAIGFLTNLLFFNSCNVVGIGIVGCFYLLLGIASQARS
jgi:hypothetical protein